MPLIPGTRLGTYEIVALLGKGGMGEVYRAKDIRLGRDVALKLLPDAFSQDAGRIARFEREARAVAGLNHPSIVVLHSIEDEDGVRFLTMELVEGQSLDNHLTRTGLPLARVLEIGIALADALTAAHEKGIIHRDLKPANVMLAPGGRVKVLDFGLAKLTVADREPEQEPGVEAGTMTTPLSVAGQAVGTVPYMAPEQVRGEAVDACTDIFALGIVLYELATGQRPFTGATSADLVSAILRDTPTPLTSLRTELPTELESIVARCLEKNPRERWQTALELCNELRRLKHAVERGEQSAPARPRSPAVVSIAVLPFINRSRNEEDDYFSDGLADELINVLARIRGFRVIARTSSFRFKGQDDDIATIGRKLNVATVLEGSLRKAGNRIRISVQLIRVADSSHLWSESYDRMLEDIFAVQDEIAQTVVKELRTTLLGEEPDSKTSGEVKAEVAQAAMGRGTNPEARRLYLHGSHLVKRSAPKDLAKGIEYLKQALALDPGFALAWAGLAQAYADESNMGCAPMADGYARSREAAERALRLAPDHADPHVRMAWIQMFYDWDWHGADASVHRALVLAPGDGAVIESAGTQALIHGRIEEAVSVYQRAVEVDPLESSVYCNLAHAFMIANRLAEAEAAYRRTLELAPNRHVVRAFLAMTMLAQGRDEEAMAEATREPNEPFRLWALAIVHHAAGHQAESDQALRELIEKDADGGAIQIAEVHASRGQTDEAFEWLERAYAQRDNGLAVMKASICLRSLHGDPRWMAFLIKMGLEH